MWIKLYCSRPYIWAAEDAVKAVSVGVAGILVSNHGGRQLDSTPATVSDDLTNSYFFV